MLWTESWTIPTWRRVMNPLETHSRNGDATARDLYPAECSTLLGSDAYEDAPAVYEEAHASCVALQEAYISGE
eukprot:3376356-Prorocentrum_lima.AAC.1